MEENSELLSTSHGLSPAEREKLLEKLLQENAELNHRLQQAEGRIVWFEEQFKLFRQRQFGKSSESANVLQVEMIFNAEEALPEKTPEAEAEVEEATETISYTRRKSNGRKIDTSRLPRIQKVHDLKPEEKMCCDCGQALHKIRDDVSEQLEIIPRQLYVVEHVHPHYTCRHCQTVTSAEKPLSPIPKGLAGASLITEVVIGKYDNYLPLYRQSQIWKSTGIDIPDNTLGNWVMQSGEGLRLLDEAMAEEIISASYLQVDETPVKVLQPEKKAYMWVYLSPLAERPLVRFRFDLTCRGEVVETDLKKFKGLLQSDGYFGYNQMRKKTDVVGFGCLAHARRKFAEIIKTLPPTTPLSKAQEAIQYFGALYKIEKEAREEELEIDERKKLREKSSLPILENFYEWLQKTKNQTLPKSSLGKAIDYTIKQWTYLIRYTHYGEVEADTNWVENEIRPFAVGRNSWLFMGHQDSAEIAAIWYSLIQSAKWNNLNPRIYVHYLLMQIHLLRKRKVDPHELLPHRIDRKQLQEFADAEFQKSKALFSAFANTS